VVEFLDKVQSNQTIMPFFVIVCGCLISVLTAAFLFGKNMQVIPLITTDGSLLYAFLFCLLSGVLPVISLGYSIRYIPPVLVDILQVFQPITSTLAGVFLLMEHITYPTLCGMALSLLVCLYITISGTVCSK
jgi:drug/metabolite transporter (DMT)-like permease